MPRAIGFREFNEDEYRKFIRTLSDEELIKTGKRLRILCGDVVTPIPSAFDRQLKICREEYQAQASERFVIYVGSRRKQFQMFGIRLGPTHEWFAS